MIVRSRFHRVVFIASGVYNIGWGMYADDPQWLFRFAGLPPLNHLQIFACLGMVVGLYGIIYLAAIHNCDQAYFIDKTGKTVISANFTTHRHSPEA